MEFGCGYGTFTIPAARIIKGVEYQSISTDKFNTIEQAEKFMQDGGKILACGTCIKSRNQEGTEMCPINTMKDMYDIVKESDKVVTF
ncbi:MAG: DsrE family protein [Candidatus Omnitrophica bacterium]|nr:DsrE family protein [Candidatus Omnitrophota bacterium]